MQDVTALRVLSIPLQQQGCLLPTTQTQDHCRGYCSIAVMKHRDGDGESI